MANMSYCRFQNTLQDLRDCYDYMDEEESLSKEELVAKQEMIDLCVDIANEFGEYNED